MCEVSRAKGEWHSRTRIKHSFAITQTEELNQPYGCVRSPPKKHTSLGREMSVCFVIISKMLCIESVVRIVWMRCCSVDWRRYGWYSEAYIPRTPADSVYGVLSLRCLGAPQLLPDCLPACVSVYASVCDVCVCVRIAAKVERRCETCAKWFWTINSSSDGWWDAKVVASARRKAHTDTHVGRRASPT